MVAQFTLRKYGVNQTFRFIEGIRLYRSVVTTDFFLGKVLCVDHTSATCSDLPSYISTMLLTAFIYLYS